MALGNLVVLLPSIYILRSIDLKVPRNLLILRVAFAALNFTVLTICYLIRQRIKSRNDQTVVTIGAAGAKASSSDEDHPESKVEEVNDEDAEEQDNDDNDDDDAAAVETTTAAVYDAQQLKKFVTSVLVGTAIAVVVHLKFGFMPPQFILQVVNLVQSPLFAIYILNKPAPSRPFDEPNPMAGLMSKPKEE